MKLDTLCVHGARRPDITGALTTPIYQTSTFAHPGVGRSTGYDYSRSQNPTREQIERRLAALEGGSGALAFTSGMAAATALVELLKPGDRIIASEDLYGGTTRLFDRVSQKNGIATDYVDTSDLQALRAVMRPETRMIFIETPSNPMMRVTDIRAAAEIAHSGGALLAVDNTFLTPYYCRPIELGADIVLHSGTKYLGGHNDTLAGFLVAAKPEFEEALRFIQKTTGAGLSPFDSFLIERGVKTLALRMDRASASALTIARALERHPRVKSVHYVGLETHPGYELSKRQTDGFGAMISFEVDSPDTACAVLEGVKLVMYAESLGGVESLITYPLLQTHADVPEEKRLALGITDRLLRLSVGVENCGDILADLENALESAPSR
ncbi:MAG: PLP-dependent aspartate aminotransferase family protein [Oscillospiraceae bacterium]|jgi:cystathionine beta-lyase/cystathionine gamma-synthase|nr:PLP-dependent aspartate aminotransferase family protein [Oscillospiraceae bacterium]